MVSVYHYTTGSRWKMIHEGTDNLPYKGRYLKEIVTGLWPMDTVFSQYLLRDINEILKSGKPLSYNDIAKELQQNASRPAIFCLLEKEPQSWIQNKEFPYIWDRMMKYTARKGSDASAVLLELEITSEDEAYVFDHAHIQRIFRSIDSNPYLSSRPDPFKSLKKIGFFLSKKAPPNVSVKSIVVDAYKEYLGTSQPLPEYDGSFSLPEVVIFNHIPLERLRLVWEKEVK